MVRKYRGKVFHISQVNTSKHGRKYILSSTGRPRYISDKHLLKEEHLKKRGGALGSFVSALGHTLVHPKKWAITKLVEDPQAYVDNQKWAMDNTPGALLYSTGKGISTTGKVLQVPTKLLNKAGREILGSTKAGRAVNAAIKKKVGGKGMQLMNDLNFAGIGMEIGGDFLADAGAADQEKMERHLDKK